ncbi:MAG: NAD-dependent epimerase/dehydratase family protein [Alphaproteobacteria bacterium]|nr:NAD-dependent epimerase/dehydratase family protein [Alphaproteobacteria bacterium]
MNNMKGVSCVVLGANGFIGTNLMQKLISYGANVKGFGRSEPNIYLKNIPWVMGDFSNKDVLTSAIKGCEIVYHLVDGSIPSMLNTTNSNILMSSVCNTINLLEICKEAGVRKIIYVSSGGTVYGITNTFPILETNPTNPICSYGINKLTSEKYIQLYHHLYNLDYTIVRLSNPFGPHQNTLKPQGIIATLITNFLKNKVTEIWGDGEIIRDYIYITDVVEGLIRLVDCSGSTKIFNIGSEIGRSINQIIADLEKIVGQQKIKINYINSMRRVDVPINILSAELIKSQIDWNVKTDWHDALNLTINWMENNS